MKNIERNKTMKNAKDNCQKWKSEKVDPRTITITANIAVADFNNGDIRVDGGNTKNKQSKSGISQALLLTEK